MLGVTHLTAIPVSQENKSFFATSIDSAKLETLAQQRDAILMFIWSANTED